MSDFPQMSAPDAPQLTQPQSSWPKVIGIISIVLGAVGAIYYVCGIGGALAGGALMESLSESMSEADRAQMQASLDLQQQYMIPSAIASLFALILAVLLLSVGIAILRTRRWSRSGALLWAGGKVVHAMAAGTLAYLSAQASAEIMKNDPNMQALGGMAGVMAALGPISALLTVLFLSAYPIFIVIWFNRGKVVEDIRAWE